MGQISLESEMPRYQWLLFDADDTLFDFKQAEAAALNKTFQQSGLVFEPNFLKVYRQISHELWQSFEKGLITGDVLKVRRFERLFEAIQIAGPATAFSARYLECLAGCAQLFEGTLEVLDDLRRDYRLAILTNGFKQVQRSRLERSAIREHISGLIISEEIGAAKPAGEFFAAALGRLGNPAKSQVLMIGDNWVSDIQGAAQFGLDTCWFNPGRKPRPDPLDITGEITSLPELAGWLRSRMAV